MIRTGDSHRAGRAGSIPNCRGGELSVMPTYVNPDNLDLKSTARFGESNDLGVDRIPTPGTA